MPLTPVIVAGDVTDVPVLVQPVVQLLAVHILTLCVLRLVSVLAVQLMLNEVEAA